MKKYLFFTLLLTITIFSCGDDDDGAKDGGDNEGAIVLSSSLAVDFAASNTSETTQISIDENDIAGGFSNDFIVGYCSGENTTSTTCINIFGGSFDEGRIFDLSDPTINESLEMGIGLIPGESLIYDAMISGQLEVVEHDRDASIIEFRYSQVKLLSESGDSVFNDIVVSGSLRLKYN